MKRRNPPVLLLALLGAVVLAAFWIRDSRAAADAVPPAHPATSGLTADEHPPLGASPALRVETLVQDLDTPWDLVWGPDDHIWVTERSGRFSRVDPSTGDWVEIGRVRTIETSESGLMGMALHPEFEQSPWVYAVRTVRSRGLENELLRIRYDGGRLGEPEVLIDGIPGAGNHDGSRLAFGPDGWLYITTGDASDERYPADLGSLGGKVLRVTPDGDPAPGNPFDSEVWSYGHRNAQGLAFHPSGALYSAEHGPNADDELNRIEGGGDFGWPEVWGACDGSRRSEDAYCREHDVIEPLAAWTPTIGIAAVEVYTGDLMPEWNGNLLVTSLKTGNLIRLVLSDDGRGVVAQETIVDGEYGRLRDVLVGPAGEIYLATSNRDGRGRPADNDDRILRLVPER